MSDKPALMIIDVQHGLIDGFENDWRDTLPIIRDLGSRARAARTPVAVIQHCGPTAAHPLHPDQPGWKLHPVVDPQPSDLRIEKRWSDAFRNTDLDAMLQAAAVTRLVLVGAQTELCVDTTARRALSLGYDVDLVADGHTTSANETLTREQIIAHHNTSLTSLAVEGVRLTIRPAHDIAFTNHT